MGAGPRSDDHERWARNARRRNARRDRELPLLAQAGIAHQAEPDWTADEVRKRVMARIEGHARRMEEARRANLVSIEAYLHRIRCLAPDLDVEELQGELEKRPWASGLEYQADYWCNVLREVCGLPPTQAWRIHDLVAAEVSRDELYKVWTLAVWPAGRGAREGSDGTEG